MTLFLRLTALLIFVAAFTGCEDDDSTPVLDVPASYAFTRAGQNTVNFSGQSERLAMAGELGSAFLDFGQTETDLNDKFRNTTGSNPFNDPSLNASSKSIRTKVAASQDLFFTNTTASAAIKADFDRWISAQVAEVFPNRNELATPGQAGQADDGGSVRYVNSRGLEYDQAFTKSLNGALMYDQIANHYLSTAILDEGSNRADNDAGITESGQAYTSMEHKWDEAFGYLFGGSSNPANPLEDLGSADDYLNKYLNRVNNDPDYAGIATELESAFRRGRAAIVARDYAERDRQAAIIKTKLANVLVIRAIYYLKQGEAGLRATPPAFGTAFHDLSEGYGFIYSLRFINDVPSFDPALVDGWLTTLANESNNGFWDINPDELANLATAIGTTFDISTELAGS